jgi:hypothetical protein
MVVEFVFDYPSPYAYLASAQLESLEGPARYEPVGIVEVMKSVNNQRNRQQSASLSAESPLFRYRRGPIGSSLWRSLRDQPSVSHGAGNRHV